MPRDASIRSVLGVGSRPRPVGAGQLVTGQACESDYSGTQAIKVLKREGLRVSLVNSNPATIMTDPEYADRTYVEPLPPEYLEAIIERERPHRPRGAEEGLRAQRGRGPCGAGADGPACRDPSLVHAGRHRRRCGVQ